MGDLCLCGVVVCYCGENLNLWFYCTDPCGLLPSAKMQESISDVQAPVKLTLTVGAWHSVFSQSELQQR